MIIFTEKTSAVDTKKIFDAITANQTYYLLTKEFWYWGECVGVFNTAEDAAAYLGFASVAEFQEEQDRLAERNKNIDGFKYYYIREFTLAELYEKILKNDVLREITKQSNKIIEDSEERINRLARAKAMDWSEKAIQLLKEIKIS